MCRTESCVAIGTINTQTTTDILDLYSDVFEGLGCITDVFYHIKVDNNAQPIVHPPRKVPVALRSKVQKELKRMEELNVIEKVEEPTD